jgi:hypothetical protein
MSLPLPYQVEQTIKQQVTITAGSTTKVSVAIPSGTNSALKGYGYTWYTTNTYKLSTGNMIFPARTDQEGSASIPRIFEKAYPIRSGASVYLEITNGDSSDHTYDVVFYFYTDQFIEQTSTGGELIIATGSGGGSGSSIAIYNSSFTTAANVTAAGLEVSPQSPATLLAGTTSTSGAAALALASSTACAKVTLRAPASNGSEICYVGNASNQTFPLYALDSIDVDIDDLAKIYIKRAGSVNVSIEYIGS